MSHMKHDRLETAFIQPGTPMFSDVMHKIETATDLSATRRRDILSGLRRVAKALNRAPEQVPADAIWLQSRLNTFAPASIGLSPKTWSNALSDARAGLVLFGVVERRISRKADLSSEWGPLWDIVLRRNDPTLSSSLPRLVHFLNRMEVAPRAVSLSDLEAYREALTLNELSRSPVSAFRSAVNAWNLAVARVPEWPRQTFTLPSRSRRIALALDAFPDTFGADLALYLDSLANPDPLDPEATASPLRQVSRTQYRNMILRFASLVVRSGVPIERIDGLAALVDIGVAERGLREMLSRTDGKSSVGISDMANLLKSIARRFVRVGEEQQKKLDHWNARLSAPAQTGMTAKNSARLRPFDNPDVLVRLLRLPQELFNRANAKKAKRRDFLAREEAIGLAILLNCPIRRKNLTQIHIERDLQRPGDGRVYMVFDTEEVKNSLLLEFDLPRPVVAMIDEHLATRSPLLCPPGTLWLFPRRDGSQPLNLTHFAERIRKRIRRETGLEMNMHLFRHLAAKIWLTEHPGQYEVVRRLLGHTNTSQTFNLYCEFEAGVATRRFSQLISKKQSR